MGFCPWSYPKPSFYQWLDPAGEGCLYSLQMTFRWEAHGISWMMESAFRSISTGSRWIENSLIECITAKVKVLSKESPWERSLA